MNLPYAIKGNRFFLSSTVPKSPFCKIKSLEVHRSSCEVGFWRGGLVLFFKQRLRFEHRKGGKCFPLFLLVFSLDDNGCCG